MRRAMIVLALLVGFSSIAAAAETAIPAAPTRWVTDQSHFISDTTRGTLDARLQRYQQATGHQVIVWIGTTLGDSPLEEWAAKAFAKWGIGQKGKDNGIAIFVFPVDHRMRIEVGYGLEDKLPDAYASRIIREVMQPELQAGRPDQALTGAVDQVLGRVGGEPNAVATPPLPVQHTSSDGPSGFTLIIGGIILVGFLILLVTNPRLAMWLLWSIMSGGRSSGSGFGGGGGGGGFSGGGGRSGGGGASGSW